MNTFRIIWEIETEEQSLEFLNDVQIEHDLKLSIKELMRGNIEPSNCYKLVLPTSNKQINTTYLFYQEVNGNDHFTKLVQITNDNGEFINSKQNELK